MPFTVNGGIVVVVVGGMVVVVVGREAVVVVSLVVVVSPESGEHAVTTMTSANRTERRRIMVDLGMIVRSPSRDRAGTLTRNPTNRNRQDAELGSR